jgi:hypothetical protein
MEAETFFRVLRGDFAHKSHGAHEWDLTGGNGANREEGAEGRDRMNRINRREEFPGPGGPE